MTINWFLYYNTALHWSHYNRGKIFSEEFMTDLLFYELLIIPWFCFLFLFFRKNSFCNQGKLALLYICFRLISAIQVTNILKASKDFFRKSPSCKAANLCDLHCTSSLNEENIWSSFSKIGAAESAWDDTCRYSYTQYFLKIIFRFRTLSPSLKSL